MRHPQLPIVSIVRSSRKASHGVFRGPARHGVVRAGLPLAACAAAVVVLGLAGCDRGGNPSADAGGPDNPAGKGQRVYAQACATCHGFTGQGMPHQGAALRTSPFVAGQTDGDLVEFIKAGRTPEDPKSTMKLLMPPKGGTPGLTDNQLLQVVAFLRQMQKEAGVTRTAPAAASTSTGDGKS